MLAAGLEISARVLLRERKFAVSTTSRREGGCAQTQVLGFAPLGLTTISTRRLLARPSAV